MLKLLLPQQEKSIKKVYVLRYCTVLLYAAAIILFYYAITFIPTFIVTQESRQLLTEQIAIAQDPSRNQDKVVLDERVTQAKQILTLLDTQTYATTMLIAIITKNQLPTITITSLDIEQVEGGKVIDVQGIATDRESLQRFVALLREETVFANVDLPFSSFTRGVDVPFSLTITTQPYDVVIANETN